MQVRMPKKARALKEGLSQKAKQNMKGSSMNNNIKGNANNKNVKGGIDNDIKRAII